LLGYKTSLKEKTISQDVSFLIVSGGSGSGKTTATREMLKVLKNLSAKVFFYIKLRILIVKCLKTHVPYILILKTEILYILMKKKLIKLQD
jgi:ABC-type oligopeptide transport system ATPase subunit